MTVISHELYTLPCILPIPWYWKCQSNAKRLESGARCFKTFSSATNKGRKSVEISVLHFSHNARTTLSVQHFSICRVVLFAVLMHLLVEAINVVAYVNCSLTAITGGRCKNAELDSRFFWLQLSAYLHTHAYSYVWHVQLVIKKKKKKTH